MPGNPTCSCGHDRRSHSRIGCMDTDPDTGKKCPCTRTYMDVGKDG